MGHATVIPADTPAALVQAALSFPHRALHPYLQLPVCSPINSLPPGFLLLPIFRPGPSFQFSFLPTSHTTCLQLQRLPLSRELQRGRLSVMRGRQRLLQRALQLRDTQL